MFEKFLKKLNKQQEDAPALEFKSFDEVENEPSEQYQTESTSVQSTDSSEQDSIELKVVRPETYAEVGAIADYLIEGCTVVMNVEALSPDTVGRMLDFLNGVTYCSEGEIKKVSKTTFIITPHEGVDISDM